MSRMPWILSCALAVMVPVVLSGCAPGTETAAPATTETSSGTEAEHDHADHEGHDHEEGEHAHAEESDAAATDAEGDEYAKAMAMLSPEDRALAEAQKICPVGGDALGGMGKPFKVDLDGRTVFLCCEGCEDLLRAEPEKYLAKIDAPADK